MIAPLKSFRTLFLLCCVVGCCFVLTTLSCQAEYLPGIKWPEPTVVTPGATSADPPSDAIVLFDGSDLSAWILTDGTEIDQQTGDKKWRIEKGAMVTGSGFIRTKESFGDCQLHIEWSPPNEVSGNGQGRGNSGIFLGGSYEIQVLDSYQNKTYFDGQAGAIYKQTPPMVNAMRKPKEWNAYDIIWTAPRFNEDGSLKSPAYMTAIHNGAVILNHFELQGDTPYHKPPSYTAHPVAGPISLQDHGNPVSYRNIWVRKITPMVGKQVTEPSYRNHETGKTWPASEADHEGKPVGK